MKKVDDKKVLKPFLKMDFDDLFGDEKVRAYPFRLLLSPFDHTLSEDEYVRIFEQDLSQEREKVKSFWLDLFEKYDPLIYMEEDEEYLVVNLSEFKKFLKKSLAETNLMHACIPSLNVIVSGAYDLSTIVNGHSEKEISEIKNLAFKHGLYLLE